MPPKLIIGCGYLGRRVAARWLANGDSVFALTRSEDRAAELRALGIEPVLGDVTQPDALNLPESDAVLYAVGFDRAAGHSMRGVYVDGLRNVLNRLPATQRFVYISSTSVYGQTNGEWIDEDSPCEPSRENGVICLEAERCVWRSRPRCANVLRLAGIYGPGRLLRRVEVVRAGEPVTGNPDAFLNLIHVDDAAAVVDACLLRGQPGRTYLVGDDQPVTRRMYFESLARVLNAEPPVFVDDRKAARTAGLNKRCSNRRIKDELQVALRYPTIQEGLAASLLESAESPAAQPP